MDPRRRRSRLRLHVALRSLLAERPLADISVGALTRRAGVARPTFYANYTAIADMLDEYISGLLDETAARHAPPTLCEDEIAVRDHLARAAERALNDLDPADPRLRAVLEGVPGLAPEARFADLVERLMDVPQAGLAPQARRIRANYHTGAFVGLVRLWVRGADGPTAAALGRAFADLTVFGRRGAPDSREAT